MFNLSTVISYFVSQFSAFVSPQYHKFIRKPMHSSRRACCWVDKYLSSWDWYSWCKRF